MSLYTSLAKPVLFALDAEQAHNLVLGTVSRRWCGAGLGLVAPAPAPDPALSVTAAGLAFPNPVGLAAGLDKQGSALYAWGALGLGAAEIGTVTPRPQPGNPRPRLFRLPDDEALINRFGFNSDGATRVAHNVSRGRPAGLRLGVNVGKNKDTPNERAIEDYLAAVDVLSPHADYFVMNVSSPNTAGLRDLQQAGALRQLVTDVVVRVAERTSARHVPVFVKISPDMTDAEVLDAADAALAGGASGIIATNTTITREGLRSPAALTSEVGGLSGAPLKARANAVCRMLFARIGRRVPIIGVGGIASADDAYERIRAGASLVQIYTALIYQGPTLVHDILRGLSARLAQDGVTRLDEVIGIDAR